MISEYSQRIHHDISYLSGDLRFIKGYNLHHIAGLHVYLVKPGSDINIIHAEQAV